MVDFVKLREEKQIRIRRKPKKINFKSIFLFFLLIFLISNIISSIFYLYTPKIAVIPINGLITTKSYDSFYQSSVSSRDIANYLYEIEKDDSVKAVILDINSEGGTAVASDEISSAIELVKLKKPVYALINDIGASGAFWIASSCNKIYSSSMSLVGSLGVTSSSFGFENFILEHNITYRKQTSAKFKDIGSPFRKQTLEEKQIIQNILDQIHNNFVNHVAKSRNLSFNYVKNYSTGEIFLGSKAYEIGFIDQIGNFNDVLNYIKKDLKIDLIVVEYSKSFSFFDFIKVQSSSFFPKIKNEILLK